MIFVIELEEKSDERVFKQFVSLCPFFRILLQTKKRLAFVIIKAQDLPSVNKMS